MCSTLIGTMRDLVTESSGRSKCARTGQIRNERRVAPIGTLGFMSEAPFLMTEYFRAVRTRPDRAIIRNDWIRQAIERPVREAVQADGRIRRWALISEAGGRALRVVLLPDQLTVHNAFFDRTFRP
jgi:hypothetical protein